MKTVLFLILFLLPCLVFAQKKSIDGFMDIPFGSDSATVKAAVFAKGGVRIDTLCKKDELSFSNFSMSGRPVYSLNVFFVNNKAYDAFFHFADTGDNILSYYDDMVADVKAIYGKPAETDNAPGLSNTVKIRKLQSGNIAVKTIWISKNKNGIVVQIVPLDQYLMLELSYQDSDLWDLKAAKRRSDL